ncbi:MAG TPA: hypothetical protein VF695_01915 [Sphingomonas sp.]|jgi:hypothetical protein
MKTDLIRTATTIALTLVTSATFILGAVGPAQAGATASTSAPITTAAQLA